MESNGVVGNIMISETTKDMLENIEELNLEFKFLKNIKIEKFQLEIKAYLI